MKNMSTIEEKNGIEYKGRTYPTRTFVFEETAGDLTIATESLFNAMCKNVPLDDWDETTEEFFIDERVYFYVEDEDMALSAEEIGSSCLDCPMTLIEEIK